MTSGGGDKKERMYLCCRRSKKNQNKTSTNCQASGVYFKHNRSLYLNEEQHNHPMGKENEDYFSLFLSKYAENKKADYVDPKWQHWLFHSRIDNLEELKKFAEKQLLDISDQRARKGIHFKCKYAISGTIKRYTYPPPYCQMRAVFIKATSSVYVRNEHSHHPAFKLKSSPKNWSVHGRISKYFAKDEEHGHFNKNKQNIMENAEENELKTPKEEAPSEEEGGEVRIVKHLQRDYKCLGRMKREGGEEEGQCRNRTDSDCWPVQDEEQGEEGMDLEEGTSQGTRRRGTFYRFPERELPRPIKKEEPIEEEADAEEEALQQGPAYPLQMPLNQPMLLRERKKRINYGK